MKRIIFTLILLTIVLSNSALAQDQIIMKNDTLNAKVLELNYCKIKFQSEDSPIKELWNHKVLKIKYENGKVEDFGSKNPRKINPLNIGLIVSRYVGEEMLIGSLELNYFIKPYLTASANFIIDDNKNTFITFGSRYYLNNIQSKNKITPFAGIQIGKGFDFSDWDNTYRVIQIPFGVEYMSKKGYNFGIHCDGVFTTRLKDNQLMYGVKLGKSF